MATSNSQKKASAKWNKSRDNIMIRPSKEEGERIRKAAAERGMSVQGFILDVLRSNVL